MIKKIAIEENDWRKIDKWENERSIKVGNMLDTLDKSDSKYFISFDIASKDSVDSSVMMKFRFVDGNYIYEGFEVI